MFLKKRPSELNNMNPVIVFLTTYGFNGQKLCTKTNEQYFPGKLVTNFSIRDHLLGTYTNDSENSAIYTLWYTHVCIHTLKWLTEWGIGVGGWYIKIKYNEAEVFWVAIAF